MSEQELEQEIDLQALANQEQEAEVEQEEEAPQLSEVEQKAFDQGWRPQEDFKGPEDNWKTAKEYVRDGEWIEKLNELKGDISKQQREFDQRLENTNKLNEARRQAEIKKLKADQRNAVDMSDTEAYDQAQSSIEQLENEGVEAPAQQQGKDPVIAEWEAKNPWINEAGNDKSIYAQGVWNNYVQANPNATNQQALAHVDSKIETLFPAQKGNPRRQQPNTTENNNRRPSNKSKTLSMSDLTASERQDYDLFGSTMFTEAEFLKTVADTRAK